MSTFQGILLAVLIIGGLILLFGVRIYYDKKGMHR